MEFVRLWRGTEYVNELIVAFVMQGLEESGPRGPESMALTDGGIPPDAGTGSAGKF